MLTATITAKGQTTIPSRVRDQLRVHASDRIVFIPDGDKVYIKAFKSGLDGVAGMFRGAIRGPIDFQKVRARVKAAVAQDLAGKVR